LRAPDLDEVGLCPVKIQLLGPHEDEGIVPVVRGEEEGLGLDLDEDLPLFNRDLEYRRVFVRAPPDPELSVRLHGRLAMGRRFLHARQVKV